MMGWLRSCVVVLVVTASLAGRAGSEEPVASPAHLASKRLTIAYAHLELQWALTGEYPKAIDAVVKPGRQSLLPQLEPSAVTDPWSAYGHPFRYRMTKAGPKLASIGPDQGWGNWGKGDSFFGCDDLIASPRTMPGLVEDYMHCVYCMERQRGRLVYPRPRVAFPSMGDVAPAKVKEMGLRKAHAPLGALDEKTIATYLEQEWNVKPFLRPFGLTSGFTGLETPLPPAYLDSCPTLRAVVGALAEASSCWVKVNVLSEKSWVMEQLPDGLATDFALGAIASLEEYAATKDNLGAMPLGEEELCTSILVFEQAHLTEEQLARLEGALKRIFGEERITMHVLGDDVLLTGFRSLSALFFAADVLGAKAPPIDEFFKLRQKLAESD